jgi:hypothetical protein
MQDSIKKKKKTKAKRAGGEAQVVECLPSECKALSSKHRTTKTKKGKKEGKEGGRRERVKKAKEEGGSEREREKQKEGGKGKK